MAVVQNKGNVYEPMDRHWHGNASEVHGGGDAGDESSQSIRDFGAIGDGVTNDSAAFLAALASGERLTGNGGVYAVSGNFELPDNFYIEDATFVQLDPNNASRRTLTKMSGVGNGTLRRVKVDRNAATTHGSKDDAAGIWFANVSDILLENVEITGNGPAQGVLTLVLCNRIQLINLYIHDCQWSAASDPGIEQITGVRIIACVDLYLLNPRIARLTGKIGAAPVRAFQTDGIALSGATNLTGIGGTIESCGEGVDSFSSNLNTNVWFYDFSVKDIDSWGIKINCMKRSGFIGCRAINCGFGAFVVGSGALNPPGTQVENLRFVNCMAVNVGSNGNWAPNPTAGFRLDWDGTVGVMPTDIQAVNFSAIDTGGTMSCGFLVAPGVTLQVINPYSIGHTVYAHVEGIDQNYMPSTFGTIWATSAGIDGIDAGAIRTLDCHVGSYAAPLALLQVTEETDAVTTYPLYLRNSFGSAGTGVGISFDPTGAGKNARDAQIVGGTTGGNVTYLDFKVAEGDVPFAVMRCARQLVTCNVGYRVLSNASSTSSASGCATFVGGVGIGENLNVGGRAFFPIGFHTRQVMNDVHDTVPTAAQLTTALGNPVTLGRGYIATIDDADGNINNFLCWTSDASWFYVKGVKAL